MVRQRRVRDGHCYQLLPSEQCPSEQQRRVVQPATQALRHGSACLAEDRDLPRWNYPRPLPKVHHSGPLTCMILILMIQILTFVNVRVEIASSI